MNLGIADDDLSTCVQCGLCLPHCPTYRVTGDEALSPRGRIHLMREVQRGGAPITDDVVAAFDTCVQCRGCEPACPSGVPYGRMIESTRETLARQHHGAPWWLRAGLSMLAHPGLLRFGSTALAVAQRARLVPRRLGLPQRLPVRRTPLRTSGSDVYLFTGCVMDAWQRDVHLAAQRVLEAAGFGVVPTGDAAPCCGALHAHAGLTDRARGLAADVIDRLDPTRPIVVDSAGCGAAMKEYGHLLGTPEAAAFSARVVDIGEWLAPHVDRLPDVLPLQARVAVQDPCHLRHVQRGHLAVRTLLRPFVTELVELADDGLCCGAGGAYAMREPDLAGAIRERKLDVIASAAPDVVASANPGCAMHLASAGVATLHPVEIVDRALRGAPLSFATRAPGQAMIPRTASNGVTR